jgi:WD40 repeat protein
MSFGLFNKNIYCVDISPNEEYFAYYYDQQAIVTKMNTWEDTFFISDDNTFYYPSSISSLKFSADNNFLYAAISGKIKFINMKSGEVEYIFEDPNNKVFCVKDIITSADNKILITSDQEGSIVRWNSDGKTDTTNTGNHKDMEVISDPSTDKLVLKSKNTYESFTLTDVLGRQFRLPTDNNAGNTYSFDMSGFAPGVYFITATSANTINTIKFIKE